MKGVKKRLRFPWSCQYNIENGIDLYIHRHIPLILSWNHRIHCVGFQFFNPCLYSLFFELSNMAPNDLLDICLLITDGMGLKGVRILLIVYYINIGINSSNSIGICMIGICFSQFCTIVNVTPPFSPFLSSQSLNDSDCPKWVEMSEEYFNRETFGLFQTDNAFKCKLS